MNTRRTRPWHLYLLALVGVALAVAAVSEIGAPTSSARTAKQVVTAEKGVVQSTVSGSGNVEAGTDVTVNFQTSGTLSRVYVKKGQHVVKGQLLATLDPTSARLTLKQAKKTLTSAKDSLSVAKNGSSSTSTSLNTTSSSNATELVDYATTSPTYATTLTTTTAPATTTTVTSTATSTVTTPTTTTGSTPTTTTGSTPTTTGTTPTTLSTTTPSSSAPTTTTPSTGTGTGSAASGAGATTTTSSASSIASAEASVYSAEASVTSAETALRRTKLYAPDSGTIVSLESLSPGDSVSSGTSSSSSSSASSDNSTSSSATTASSGSLTSSSSSSTSSFAEIINTHKLTMTVAFSESDISKVKVGQAATVTLEALTGVELAAHVSAISAVGTTSSSVVSYDATLILDQHDKRVKPGMSATASVITGQSQGVTVPNDAVTGTGSLATVSLQRGNKTVQRQVVVGLKGDSRTTIISGLKAGDQLVVTSSLPSATSGSSSSGSSGSSGTLGGTGSRLGGGGGGGFPGGGGGFSPPSGGIP
jgi:macrolide-specific efflux system membrane fusion protein